MNKQIIVNENEFITLPFLWNGKENALSYDVYLRGRGARCDIYGLLLGKNDQTLQLNANVFHEAPNTVSNVIINGAVTDMARVNFEGLVKIDKGAKQSNAKLAAHILLLSDQAKGRAIPGLEILENDVKASHATTVGKVDEMQLFYLMSRGLTRKLAKKLIIEGFLMSLFNKLPVALQEKVVKELQTYAK